MKLTGMTATKENKIGKVVEDLDWTLEIEWNDGTGSEEQITDIALPASRNNAAINIEANRRRIQALTEEINAYIAAVTSECTEKANWPNAGELGRLVEALEHAREYMMGE